MTTFLQIKNLVYAGLARDTTDSAAALIVPYAVNWAVKATAIMFRPKELAEISVLTILSGNTYAEFNYIFIDISGLVTSDGDELHFIPFEGFRSLIKWVTTGPRYYTTYGKYIITNAKPTTNLIFAVYWLKLPDDLTADSTDIPFFGHDSFIVSLACGIAFAMFEEGDTVDIWSKVANLLGMSMAQRTKMQEVMMGVPASLEAQITGYLSGSQ